MFRLDADLQVYLHRDAVDFRKGINGLAAPIAGGDGVPPSACFNTAMIWLSVNRDRFIAKLPHFVSRKFYQC